MKFHMLNLLIRSNVILTAANSPGDIFKNIMTDFKTWLLAGMGIYAAVQFILGCMDFMSKEPQKHSAGKDHMVHAGIGLVLAFQPLQ
ncbi:hypothetical protein [Enterococcus rivorum]|uniref:hypothetical protein n=1 Tax=Enterococcus rivorum TaxID=762845 RepID=UPI003633C2F4